MFKNILKFLFEEEEDEIIEDQPLEDISIRQSVDEKKPIEKPTRTRVEPVKATPPPLPKKQFEEVKKPVEAKVVTSSDEEIKPKNRFINFDEPQTTSRSNHYPVKSEAKRDYEVSPVISPIFGTKEDQAARSVMNQDDPVVRVKKKNPLGTIISPMYGARELEEMEDEAQARLAKQDSADMETQVTEAETYNTIEARNVPLEELIASEEDDLIDDVMQFSLFGGEEAIKKADEAHVYALDEDE